jgi:hypothetical protein
MNNAYKIVVRILQGRSHLGHIGADERIILK